MRILNKLPLQPFFLATPPEWVTISQVNMFGAHFHQDCLRFDQEYGHDNWRLGFWVNGQTKLPLEIVSLLEQSYEEFFRRNPSVFQWLQSSVRDVYVYDQTDTYTGTEYSARFEAKARCDDIIIRNVLKKLNGKFSGHDILRIHEDSPGQTLSTGNISFINPQLILTSTIKGWWQPNSIEAFLRNNGVMEVKGSLFTPSSSLGVAIIYRQELKIGTGKKAVHAAHGAVTVLNESSGIKLRERWFAEGKHVQLWQVPTLANLEALKKQLGRFDVPSYLIQDAGLTQVPSGTTTVLAVGPSPRNYLDYLLQCFNAFPLH